MRGDLDLCCHLGSTRSAMLERVLMRRFGEVPQSVKQRIQGASADIIETWFDRALDAPDLAAVFGEAPPLA